MIQQAEFMKNVRETFTKAQTTAAGRLETLVEKGRASQKDLADRLARLEMARLTPPEVKATVGLLQKRVKSAGESALGYVDATGRQQAATVAVELRKLADRLEKISQRSAATAV